MIPVRTGQLSLNIVTVFVESLNRCIEEFFEIPTVFVKNSGCLLYDCLIKETRN